MIYQPYEESPELKVIAARHEIKTLPGITVTLVGAWLWVSGNTKPHREALKAAGFKWSPNKLQWYFAGVSCASSRGRKSYRQIADKYGEYTL